MANVRVPKWVYGLACFMFVVLKIEGLLWISLLLRLESAIPKGAGLKLRFIHFVISQECSYLCALLLIICSYMFILGMGFVGKFFTADLNCKGCVDKEDETGGYGILSRA